MAAPLSDFDERLAKFAERFVEFYKHYLGCPDDVSDINQCRKGKAELNRKEYEASREAAKRLYQFD